MEIQMLAAGADVRTGQLGGGRLLRTGYWCDVDTTADGTQRNFGRQPVAGRPGCARVTRFVAFARTLSGGPGLACPRYF
jgi:hypothetical protein